MYGAVGLAGCWVIVMAWVRQRYVRTVIPTYTWSEAMVGGQHGCFDRCCSS